MDKIIRCDAAGHIAQLMHHGEDDAWPVLAPDHLSIAVWQRHAALRSGLIPPAAPGTAGEP
ncbi:MAG: hypothetical protein ACLPN6_07260 [Streptosporangiaceae bacterium]|jgi:hypothetical protein|nr:hypothetical protein [Actinomycetota bacterium]